MHDTMRIKHIIIGINLLLIALCIYLAVGLFYRIHTAGLVSEPPVGSAPGRADLPPPKNIRSAADSEVILKRDLFGVVLKDSAGTRKPVDIESLKPTALQLKLWGTVLHENGTAYAIIEDLKTRKQKLYRPGDAIETATIRQILREKVILSVGDRNEMLEMPSEKSPGVDAAGIPSHVGASASDGAQVNRNADVLTTHDVRRLLGEIGIRPHLEHGRPAGLELTRISGDSLFHRMGLVSGDIILGANGKPIRTVNDLVDLYREMGSSPEAKIQIQRNGQTKTVDFGIQ